MARCSESKYLAIDTEGFTAATKFGISVAHPALESMYFPIGHREDVNIDEDVQKLLTDTIYNVRYRVFHHAGHDINILPDLFDRPFACTMVMAHMIDENVMSKSLDFLHKFYCGGEGKLTDPIMENIKKSMGWEFIPFELMNAYAVEDARITMELFIKLLPLYEEQFGPLWSKK